MRGLPRAQERFIGGQEEKQNRDEPGDQTLITRCVGKKKELGLPGAALL